MKHRLIIVEGLPCSGKSSLSQFIAETLSCKEYKVSHYDEGMAGHPADYEFHACMTEDDFRGLTNKEIDKIKECASVKQQGFLIPLETVDEELFNKIIPYKIYDCLPWEKERPIILEHWKEFRKRALIDDDIYVFNCCFLQNPLCETMMRFNLPYEIINDYIKDILDAIKELDPVIIYLESSNVGARVSEVAVERGEEWLQSVIHYHVSQGYGKAHNLDGFDGYIRCLEKRQEVELRILEELPVQKFVIANPYEDWQETKCKISSYLNQIDL